MASFHLPSSTPSLLSTPTYTSDNEEEEDTLPYPTPLPRTPFLDPSFSPHAYLATLRNRHQTLEDLRADLRQRSHLLQQELLELVNDNYEDFLALGGDLKGGEEKVEGVRVGVLAFEREVRSVLGQVRERESEVEGLVAERRQAGGDVKVGRALLEIEGVIGELEGSLGITEREDDGEETWDDDDQEDEEEESVEDARIRRVRRQVERYVLVIRMIERLGASHPFLLALRSRVEEVRKTLLLDLAAALRQAKAAKQADRLLVLVGIYGEMGAEAESLRVLRGT